MGLLVPWVEVGPRCVLDNLQSLYGVGLYFTPTQDRVLEVPLRPERMGGGEGTLRPRVRRRTLRGWAGGLLGTVVVEDLRGSEGGTHRVEVDEREEG